MDPVTLLQTISAAVELAGACYEIGTFLYGMRSSYKETNSTLRSIETECRIFQAAVSHIQRWLEAQTEQSVNDLQIQGVKSALSLINESMTDLKGTLQKITERSGGGDTTRALASRWVKAKFVVYEETLKGHLTDLREHARLVQFALAIIQLKIPNFPETATSNPEAVFEQVAARAYAIRRARTTKAQKLVEKDDDIPGKVTTANSSPTAQDQTNEMSVYHKSIAHEAQETSLPRRHDTTPPPPYIAMSAHQPDLEQTDPNSTAFNVPMPQLAQWPLGSPMPQTINAMDEDPSYLFNVTASNPRWDAWQLPEMPAESIADDSGSSAAMLDSPPEPPVGYPATAFELPDLPFPVSPVNDKDRFAATHLSTNMGTSVSLVPKEEALASMEQPQAVSAQNIAGSGLLTTAAEVAASSGVVEKGRAAQSCWERSTRPPETRSQSEGLISHILADNNNSASFQVTDYADALTTSTKIEQENEPFQPLEAIAQPVHYPRHQYCHQSTSGNTSKVSLVSALSADTASSSRKSSIFSKSSSVWSTDSTFSTATSSTAATDNSQLRKKPFSTDLPLLRSPLSGLSLTGSHVPGPLVRRKPVGGSMDSQGHTPSSHKTPFQHDSNSTKTSLQLAVAAEHVEVVERLLARSTLRPTDVNFTSAFFTAIEVGNVRLVEVFISKGAILKGLKSDSHKPITLAAKSGSVGMVDLIIRLQGKVGKEKDSNGWTALHYAAHYGHTPIVERLADKETPSSKTTSKKETPLHLAVKAQQFGVAELLLRTKGRETINLKDTHGQQALHHAARGGDRNIVNLLFSHQAKIDVENAFGWEPLHIAVAYGHLDVVEQLLDHGASISERLGTTDYNRKDTHSYVEAGYWAEACWPFPGSKALHLATEFGHAEIVRFLHGRGAKVDSADGEGWRPLHLAAFTASPALVEFLLSAGAYPHAVTDMARQRTPFDIARWRYQSSSLPNATNQASESDLLRCQEILHNAMATVPKRGQEQYYKSMKILSGKGPEEKNEYLRAATVAMDVIKRGSELELQRQISRYS